MATELERIAALETHLEHVDKTLTAMGRTLEAIRTGITDLRETVRTEIDGVRTELGSQIDGVRTELGGRIEDVRTELGGRIEDVRTELGGRIEDVRAELGGEVKQTRTELGGRIEDVRTELGGEVKQTRTELGGRMDALEQRVADESASRNETKLKVALRVIGWLVGIVTTVLGAVIGGLFRLRPLPAPETGVRNAGGRIGHDRLAQGSLRRAQPLLTHNPPVPLPSPKAQVGGWCRPRRRRCPSGRNTRRRPAPRGT